MKTLFIRAESAIKTDTSIPFPTKKVYLWNTYKSCKEQQLNLGLDLQGEMSVVLQVSLKELLLSLSDNSRDPEIQ